MALSAAMLVFEPVFAATQVENVSANIGPQFLVRKGFAQINSGNLPEAINTLSAAVKADRDSLSARRYLSYALLQSGDFLPAISQLDAMQKLGRPSAFDLNMYGEAQLGAGNRQAAEKSFRAALDLDPNMYLAQAGMIKILVMDKRFSDARAICEAQAAGATDPRLKQFWTQLSMGINESVNAAAVTTQAAHADAAAPISAEQNHDQSAAQAVEYFFDKQYAPGAAPAPDKTQARPSKPATRARS